MHEPRTHLSALGLSDSEVTVYLAMVSGVRTPRDLVKTTGLKRPTVYYVLGSLEKRGLVSKTDTDGGKGFSLEPIERLVTIAKTKADEMIDLQERIGELVPILAATHSPVDAKPGVTFYEGVDAVQGVIMEMLYCKSKHIDSIVPQDNFFWQVRKAFVERFIEERTRRKIHTRNLWEATVSKDLMKQYYKGLSEVRILPKVMHGKFNTSIFVYGDKTLYVSSKKNSYCVLVTSKEHADTMRAMFDGLWQTSKSAD